MPLTRNQRSSQTSSSSHSEQNISSQGSTQDETKKANTSASSASAMQLDHSQSRSPSPKPRSLRDRRSLITTKPFGDTVPSDYILHRPTQKRPSSTSPSGKKEHKLQSDSTQVSPSKASDKTDLAASSQSKSTEKPTGTSLLHKLSKPSVAQPTKTSQTAACVKPTLPPDAKRHDYTRVRPPATQAPPKTIEGILQNAIRAKLLSNNPDNQRIDLSAKTTLPSAEATKNRAPVRITLPSSPTKTYDLSTSSETPRSSSGESRQIEVINFNSSLLRRYQSTSSVRSSSPRNGAINLTTSNHSTPDVGALPVDKFFNVLIAVTGSVAAVKLIELVGVLKSKFPKAYVSKLDGREYKANLSIQIILTENAKHFLPSKLKIFETLGDLTIKILDDADEWSQWKNMGDPVLHIELRKWADLMVIAPLDANTMAKIATGICDNLLTCVVRAWDLSKRLLFCPAMNVNMYEHPITREQISKLQSFGYVKIDCIKKRLACGDTGIGAMAQVETIANKVVESLLAGPVRSVCNQTDSVTRHPTYPIISSSLNTSGSPQVQSRSSTSSLHAKYIAPGQMSMHNYINVRSSAENPNNREAECSRLSEPSQKTTSSNQISGPVTVSHRPHPNLVTSLQNLQAINSNNNLVTIGSSKSAANGKEAGIEHDNDDIIDQATPEDCNSDYSYNGFDPTDLLEQSLSTGESLPENNGSTRNNTVAFLTTNVPISARNFAGSRKLERRPVFNTTKILDSCFDKDRNRYLCSMCQTDYKNRKSIARHMKEQHLQGNIYECLECGLSYKRREKLIKHNKIYHKEFEGLGDQIWKGTPIDK